MNVYCYNPKTGEFTAEVACIPNGKGFFIPAFSTETPPPEHGEHQAAVYKDGAWSLVPDYRDTAYWTVDGTEHKITALGETIPDGASLIAPPPPPPTPEEILAAKKAERQAAVDALTVTTSTGKVFDGDETAQGRMARAIQAAGITGITETLWVLSNSTPATVTLAELEEALALAIQAMGALWVKPYEAAE